MKKALSLILAVMMLLGCMSVTALATESDGTWSYDPNTNTFTVNCTIPKKETLNTAIPEEVSITPTDEITGITGLAATWGKTCEENGFLYDSKMWNAARKGGGSAVFEANTEYGYLIVVAYNPSVLQKDLSAAKIDLNGKEYSNVGNTKLSDTYAEMFIAVDFGTLDEKGNFIGGDFSEPITSGNTDITLTVAKALTYDMVIPEDATNLNAAGIYSVGQAKVENVENATEKTVISYTAETTAFKCEGKNDIPASYYTEQAATNAFPTDAVTVYENKAEAASIPTMWVKIAEDDWNAAENGTYTATVTFNFSTKEVTPVTAADALVENAYFKLDFTTTQPYNGTLAWSMTYHKTASGFEATELLENNENVLTFAAKDIQVNANGSIITINMGWEYPLTFTLDTGTNIYEFTGTNNEVTFTSFSVKPAGATEFTEVTLTEATPR